ncbi:MAG TPA: XylR family transcriptional regulator [Tepidisphaeraceae bacterium]|jgi:LacI family transcriptional regulator|nr:XylR family transcriptional regulator [Tepidisphaeraceae bacterium]
MPKAKRRRLSATATTAAVRKPHAASATSRLHGATPMPRRRIAVLVSTSTLWGRRLVAGILHYAREQGSWALTLDSEGPASRTVPPAHWDGDGVIGRVACAAGARDLAKLRVPVVNVSGIRLRENRYPRVANDGQASSRLAGQFLLDRGYRRFGYYASRWTSSVGDSYAAFARAVGEAGCTCERFVPSAGTGRDRRRALAAWVERLQRPAAVFTWAQDGVDVLEACRAADILVPQDLAVLGGDDDDLRCAASTPSLSAIVCATERVGYEAAGLLDRLMRGETAPTSPILIPPTHVTERASTEAMAIEDADVRDAVQFIQAHVIEPITVEDILRRVPVSRRSLEYRFERIMGRTPAAHLRRLRVERVKELLIETQLPISDVAIQGGFGSPEYLSAAFKQAEGTTPLKFRQQFQALRARQSAERRDPTPDLESAVE